MSQLLGIDCGGTATEAVLVEEGTQVWTGSGGPANLASCSAGVCRASLEAATAQCPTPAAVCGAFAGLVSEDQRREAETLLHDLFPRSTVAAVPDFEAALVACGPGIDVCVLAGTGSFVCSFGPDGIVHRSGGKGHLLGDEGSAFQYGREALQHFLEAPPDDVSETLRLSVLEGFGSMRKPEVTAALHAVPDPARLLASLAPAFAADAEAEAVYALRALRIHPGKLAHQVSMHLRQHHPNLIRPRIGCQGGLWRHAIYRDAFAQQLGFWCRAEELEAEFDLPAPVHGAAEIAGRLI